MIDEWPSKFLHPGYQKYDNHHADFKNEINAPTPLKQLIHFAQMTREGGPIYYNYMDNGINNAAYGVDVNDPPMMDLSSVSDTPLYVV